MPRDRIRLSDARALVAGGQDPQKIADLFDIVDDETPATAAAPPPATAPAASRVTEARARVAANARQYNAPIGPATSRAVYPAPIGPTPVERNPKQYDAAVGPMPAPPAPPPVAAAPAPAPPPPSFNQRQYSAPVGPTPPSPPSAAVDVPEDASSPSALRDRAVNFFVSKGWSREQAIGLAANIRHESDFDHKLRGDGNRAYGLFQWHPDRQAEFRRMFGHDIQDSTFDEQLEFAHRELTDGAERTAGAALRNATTAQDAAELASLLYERPAGGRTEARARGKLANRWSREAPEPAAAAPEPAAPEPPPSRLDERRAQIRARNAQAGLPGDRADLSPSGFFENVIAAGSELLGDPATAARNATEAFKAGVRTSVIPSVVAGAENVRPPEITEADRQNFIRNARAMTPEQRQAAGITPQDLIDPSPEAIWRAKGYSPDEMRRQAVEGRRTLQETSSAAVQPGTDLNTGSAHAGGIVGALAGDLPLYMLQPGVALPEAVGARAAAVLGPRAGALIGYLGKEAANVPMDVLFGAIDEALKSGEAPKLRDLPEQAAQAGLARLVFGAVGKVTDRLKRAASEAPTASSPAPAAKPTELTAKDVEGMSPEELRQHAADLQRQLYESEVVPGVPNRRAWNKDIQGTTQHVASIDIDNLKPVNDVLGHQAGDALIQANGEALRLAAEETGAKVAHLSGDEFRLAHDDPAVLEQTAARAREILNERDIVYENPDGSTVVVPKEFVKGFSHGIGPNEAAAEVALGDSKRARLAQGIRTERRPVSSVDDAGASVGSDSAGGQVPSRPAEDALNQTGKPGTPASASTWDIPQKPESARGVSDVEPPKGGFDVDSYVREMVDKREAARTKGASSQLWREFKAALVDSTSPITDTLAKYVKDTGTKLLPSEDINNHIDRVLRSVGLANQFVEDHGLNAIIREVPDIDTLDQYMIAKQAKAIAETDRATGRDLDRDEQLITAAKGTYEPYAQAVTKYSQDILDYAAESGLISKDFAEHLKQQYPEYVPLRRIFSQIENTTPEIGGQAVASLSSQTVVRQLKGSEREIESPIRSLLEKTADAFVQGEKNKAAKVLASYRDLSGNPFQISEIEGPKPTGVHTFSYLDDGVKRTFAAPKEIVQAAKSLDVQRMNLLARVLAMPVRVARVGITGVNPAFLAANVARDQLTGFLNSPQGLATIGNPSNFTRSLFEALKHGELFDEMMREGALGTSYDLARTQITNTIENVRSQRTMATRIDYLRRHPLQLLRSAEDLLAKGEVFTRIQHYIAGKEAALKAGLPEEEARIAGARNARENTTNFLRRGEWGTALNSMFLYLNANIQGTRTLLRAMKTRPKETGAKIATAVFLPVAMATAWNMADPDRRKAYEDIADFEKENNIILVPPNPTIDEKGRYRLLKIPLSQEVNNIARIPRRAIEAAFGADPVAAGDIAEALIGTVSPVGTSRGQVISSILSNPAARVPAELSTNKNFFTNREIVPDSERSRILKELRTGGTARAIAKQLGVSPLYVEEAIRETIGGTGSQAINAIDNATKLVTGNPDYPVGGESTPEATYRRFGLAYGGERLRRARERQNQAKERALQSRVPQP